MEPFDLALVERYRRKPDWRRYVSLIQAAAAAGNDWARYVMATWFLHGFREGRIRVNRPRALRLLRSASRSCPNAMVELARILEDGIDVRRDHASARRLLVKASEFGSVHALIHLAWIYGEGVNVRADHAKARRLMRRAAKLGLTIDSDDNVVARTRKQR